MKPNVLILVALMFSTIIMLIIDSEIQLRKGDKGAVHDIKIIFTACVIFSICMFLIKP